MISCKLEHLIYVEDDDDDEDDDEEDDEDDDEEGFGNNRKGDVARAARLLGISLPQLGYYDSISRYLRLLIMPLNPPCHTDPPTHHSK